MAANNNLQNRPDEAQVSTAEAKIFHEPIIGLVECHRFAVACIIIVLNPLFLIPALDTRIQNDVHLYQGVANDLLVGKMPYRDRVVEYPPYAIPLFLPPRIFGEDKNYLEGFMVFVLLADLEVKSLLFVLGAGQSETARSLLPLLLYCAAIPFVGYFFLQRYDVFPVLICLLAVWLFCSGRFTLCGLAIALGIGVKLYPVIFVPPLFVFAFRQNKWKQFALGLAGGLLPMALLGFYLPWWRFAQFQADRGLQVESLYASVLWLGKLLGLARVVWIYPNRKAWLEVQGAAASAVLPWARAMFAGTVAISMALATWAALRLEKPTASQLARVLLLPLLAFVAFNQVLSPQYMVWLLPLAALAVFDGRLWLGLAITLATMLTPIIYPSLYGDYVTGLNLFETIVLLLRNLILVAVWAWLFRGLCLAPYRKRT